jgi:(E)-4-hydroxy-3-methylbut-2-enyl-diphosphate synthase
VSVDVERKPTRAVAIGAITIGNGHPVAVQSMTATRTTDVTATVGLVDRLVAAGADLVRIAVDSRRDAESLAEVRARTSANLSVDLQENYRLAELVAPHVDKIRYNPGHLYHHERNRRWQDKVRYLVDLAGQHDVALRVGVNCGSIDPAKAVPAGSPDSVAAMLASALEHCDLLDTLGFQRYCVSLKDSDPWLVIRVNERFSAARPEVPLHLGVTEAGLPPEGIIKTRIALVRLLRQGIGDTIRVSLTVPNERKPEEVVAGRAILEEVRSGADAAGLASALAELNIISCPSCSRVENEAFIELAERVREMTRYARDFPISIAVMGCRVNGPGETDEADLGLWCGPKTVNLKRGETTVGAFRYDEILARLKAELDQLIEEYLARSKQAEE